MRDVAITVAEADSDRPAGRLPVRVVYAKQHPLGFLIAGIPEDLQARTDANGKAVIKLADYTFGINLYAGSSRFVLRKKDVRDGGIVDEVSKAPGSSRFRLKLEPIGKRPKGAAANRRPVLQSDGSDDWSATLAADRVFPAAVAELGRSTKG